jgi:uncharacterized protein (TIGR00299 family) protein
MEVHLDPLGGMAGDMFIAAVLHAFPEHEGAIDAAIAALAVDGAVGCRLVPFNDGVLAGRRFLVDGAEPQPAHDDHAHHHDHHHHGRHHHDGRHDDHRDGHAHPPGRRAWRDIRRLIADSALEPPVKDHAIGIFTLLAEAEARVHGVAADAVTFHEVGAIDSIVDIVGAAQLIARLNATRWTIGPLPLGSGRVRCEHGWLPVPPPATALLLEGMETIDDGVAGERVTPTGAAIARYLTERAQSPQAARRPAKPRRLGRTGIGFGTRDLPGLSNCLRLLSFEPVSGDGQAAGPAVMHRELAVIQFEVDDQSPEDLALGLTRIRGLAGVHDVIQTPVLGKKGRMAAQVQALVAPDALEAAIDACFAQTTTIGLRHHVVAGRALPRRIAQVEIDGRPLRVKLVDRPDGERTAKAEADDVADALGQASRVRARRMAETIGLAKETDERC